MYNVVPNPRLAKLFLFLIFYGLFFLAFSSFAENHVEHAVNGEGGTRSLGSASPTAHNNNMRQVTQWWPYLEWVLSNPDYTGNPFDLKAEVVFTHRPSGNQIRTGMFYAGKNQWRFRFTGTRLGTWTFTTHSIDPDLHGHTGAVNVVEQKNPRLGRGFVSNAKAPFWSWSSNGKAFIPTLVMRTGGLEPYLENPNRIGQDIKDFLAGHGFAGFHFRLPYTWFDVHATGHDEVENVGSPNLNPDPRSFELMEEIIKKTYQAGGFVHLWQWGKAKYNSSTKELFGGVNGLVMRRLQRYLAARLGAIPGWTLGFGFDMWEDQNGADLKRWHAFYKQHLGWDHVIGARAHRNDAPVIDVMTDRLDYIGHEDHRTIEYKGGRAYDRFVEWLEAYPDKVHFSEDRFRINFWSGSRKFTPERVRRTLWHSGMAGGIAAIYGQADPAGNFGEYGESYLFKNKQELRTFATFFERRLTTDLRRTEGLIADGYGLVAANGSRALAYIEDASTLALDLSKLREAQPAVAVDARRPYQERALGLLTPDTHLWQAPYKSDWAIAVGHFPPGE